MLDNKPLTKETLTEIRKVSGLIETKMQVEFSGHFPKDIKYRAYKASIYSIIKQAKYYKISKGIHKDNRLDTMNLW